MTKWEYRKIDLNLQRPRSDELDSLNDAGAEGWELVGITSNNIAYLKRQVEGPDRAGTADAWGAASLDAHANAQGNVEAGRQKVGVKYRDPQTHETWSGRGRMANWLKRKRDAGEDIEEYLV